MKQYYEVSKLQTSEDHEKATEQNEVEILKNETKSIKKISSQILTRKSLLSYPP